MKTILIYRKLYHNIQQRITKRCRTCVVNQIEIEIKSLRLLQTHNLFVITSKNLLLHNLSTFSDSIDYICKNSFKINLRKKVLIIELNKQINIRKNN